MSAASGRDVAVFHAYKALHKHDYEIPTSWTLSHRTNQTLGPSLVELEVR